MVSIVYVVSVLTNSSFFRCISHDTADVRATVPSWPTATMSDTATTNVDEAALWYVYMTYDQSLDELK